MVTTFVGRDHELALLADLRGRALAGQGQLVVVTGEVGIGKTWFCDHVSATAGREGFTVVRGRCWPHGDAPPLWPWTAMLPALVGADAAGPLGMDPSPDQVEPERIAALSRSVAEIRRDIPTMIVIDDAQHADESALLLTRFLAGALDRLPLVLVLAGRASSTDGDPAAALFGALGRKAATIALRPFGLDDVAALLAAHGQPDRAPDVPATLLRITGGNPLRLAQAIDRGRTGARHSTVDSAVTDAVDRLPPVQRRVLAYTALLGVDGTVNEVAGLAGTAPDFVRKALAAAGAGSAGRTADRYELDDAVRQVLLDTLDVAERLDAHARAAVLLAGSGQVERAARHALAAAVRSPSDAERAITVCRAAAAELHHGHGYAPAAELLGRAAVLAEQLADLPRNTELLVERADTVLASGRLTDARTAFEAAADAAERAANPVLLARAVLGLGGVWVHEHRHAAVRQQLLARQRAALDALPEHERSLRCRLTVRLASEAVYEGRPVQTILDALADARALGDNRVLAEALSLTHHALLGPEHAALRSRLAEEQIAAAASAGDGILALFGLLWRTVDLYLDGHPDAERSLAELRRRSATLDVATVNYVVAGIEIMRLIRAGRLAEAAAAADRCLRLGLEIGDADATGYYGVQLLTIRWLQGRDAELADAVLDTLKSATLTRDDQVACRASAVMALAHGGRVTEARVTLLPLLDRGLATMSRSGSWLGALVMVVEAARTLGDTALAAEAAQLLRPYADQPAMATLAVSCLGSVSRALGQAALTTGAAEAAVAHLEHALAANRRIDHRPAAALTRAQLAEALLARAEPGDGERAWLLLTEAADDAAAMDMSLRVETWSARAEAIMRPAEPIVLRRGRAGWTVAGEAVRIELPDLIGLHYLSCLLERPGHELTALELRGAVEVGGRHELLDDTAVAAYRQWIRDLDAAIDDAEANGDKGKARRLRHERAAVADELTRALGLGGRSRRFSSPAERARVAVRKAITRAMDAIGDQDPVLGAELRRAVNTGVSCSYRPTGRRWRVERIPPVTFP
jgi:hypothetical protein